MVVLGFMFGFSDCCIWWNKFWIFWLLLDWDGFLFLILSNFLGEFGSGEFFCINKCFFFDIVVICFWIFLFVENSKDIRIIKIFSVFVFMFDEKCCILFEIGMNCRLCDILVMC